MKDAAVEEDKARVNKDIQEHLFMMNVLIVDDLQDNRDLIVALLEDEGYTSLIESVNGKEALDILQSETVIDLVLLDINMPLMDGYELLEYMKGSDRLRFIPVIMVSAISQLDSTIRCIEKGAEDYLVKPVEETLLWARVHASLERKYLRNKERDLLEQVQAEKQKSEELLYHIIPESVADRLRRGEENIADTIDDVTVLFADIAGFTQLSTDIEPSQLVQMLNQVFRYFDELAAKLRLEKIKTIGDAYMVVGGIPPHTEEHEKRSMDFATGALQFIRSYNQTSPVELKLRIGMHSGPVVAGVIGQTRFTYDLWGQTVNVASRMESLGVPGCVQVPESTYGRLGSIYSFTPRGKIEVKGVGEMETYLFSEEGGLTEKQESKLLEESGSTTPSSYPTAI